MFCIIDCNFVETLAIDLGVKMSLLILKWHIFKVKFVHFLTIFLCSASSLFSLHITQGHHQRWVQWVQLHPYVLRRIHFAPFLPMLLQHHIREVQWVSKMRLCTHQIKISNNAPVTHSKHTFRAVHSGWATISFYSKVDSLYFDPFCFIFMTYLGTTH